MAKAVLEGIGKEIFEKRYAYPGEKTWIERARVIAKVAASAESDDDKEAITTAFYNAVANGDFIPGGRIIYGAGRNVQGHNLLNCYVLVPDDNVESLATTFADMYKISCAGGGVGFNVSNIRPKGDNISNVKNSAPGSVSVLQTIDGMATWVKAGRNRRVALMAILNVDHPDLLEFLHIKLDLKQLTNFNISVAITNKFLEAIENEEDWVFKFNNKDYHLYDVARNNGEEVIRVPALSLEDALARANEFYRNAWTDTFDVIRQRDIKAREVWDIIWTNAVESGDPGIYNIDLANSYTNVSYFERLEATNPCGEISLANYGNCCLGNINLDNMVLPDGSDLDWKRLARAVRVGVRFLDNILTINTFPVPECKVVAERSRRIGLGVMGLHYMLIRLGIRYGSEKCLEFLDRLFSTIRDEAYKQSLYLARARGPFKEFNAKKYLSEAFSRTLPARIRMLIKEHGIRNAVMLTIPPTGTTSMLFGVSSGVEPIFAAMYNRTYRDGSTWKTQLVVDPLFKEYYEQGKNLDVFAGAYDVTPEEHILVQATIQKYIDSCISKTINLPSFAKADDLSRLALRYVPYLKGLTMYRQNSRAQEPLQAIPLTEDNIKKYMALASEQETASSEVCSLAGGSCGA